MSEARITQLLEGDAAGWTAVLITAVGAETKEVKATEGKIARIRVNTASITVTPKDATAAVWGALTDAAEFVTYGTPIKCATSIQLTFSGAGNAWVLYK